MQGMTKVGIFLGADPGSGGMFQYSLAVMEALSALPRDDHEVVAAFFDPAWRPYVEPLGLKCMALGTEAGREPFTAGKIWRTLCLPLAPWRRFLWRLDPVARALRATDCDLWVFPAQDHWGYMAPVPAMVTIHDLMHRYEPQFPEVSRWGRHFLREHRFRNICRHAKAVLVDSETGRKHVMESYGLGRDRIFPLPYLPPRYIYAGGVPEGFDSRYSLPPRFLFYPAQFWQHKNHDRLLQAMATVSGECPDINLVLAGPMRHEYPRLVQRVEELGLHGRVLFTGYVPDADLPEFYRRARALVMPTFFGPTNIPPLEAFALGCPVAVSGIYGIPEQVGDAALLFDPRSVPEIAAAIRSLWLDDDLCRQLSARGMVRAELWGQKDFNASLQQIMSSILEMPKSGKD
jgi:glycosyltransferase involved in cell wall biosynthesis